jgi:ribulose bisphosphate carboxylase small subunit
MANSIHAEANHPAKYLRIMALPPKKNRLKRRLLVFVLLKPVSERRAKYFRSRKNANIALAGDVN